MSRSVRKYENKKILARSTSESLVNALFAKNIFARNLQTHAKRKKRLELSALPPVDANHVLLHDSGDSLRVKRSMNDTFDKLKHPFDQLNKKDESMSRNQEEDSMSYSHMFDESKFSSDEQKDTQKTANCTNLDISDKKPDNDGEFMPHCSTPIKNKPTSADNGNASNMLEKSMLQIHNWSYIAPDASAYIPVSAMKRKIRSRRCKAVNGYKLDQSKTTPEKSIASFVAMKFASNQSLDQQKQLFEASNDSKLNAEQSKMKSVKFRASTTSENESNLSRIKKTHFTLDDFENFTKSLSAETINSNYIDEEYSYDDTSINLESNDSKSDQTSQKTQKSKDNTEGITLDSFEDFYNSVKDSIVITKHYDSDEISNASIHETETSSRGNTFRWVTKKRRKITNNSTLNISEVLQNDESLLNSNKHRFVTRRVLRSSTRAKINASNDQAQAKLEKSLTPNIKKSKNLEIISPDLFASTEDDESMVDELSSIDLQISRDESEDVEELELTENKNISLRNKQDEQKQSTESTNMSNIVENCINLEETKDSQIVNDIVDLCNDSVAKTDLRKQNVSTESNISEEDQFRELPKICLKNQRKSNAKPIQIQPGKLWRRSLAVFKRKTLSEVSEGEKCQCADCVQSITARRTRFTLCGSPAANQRQTQYERDRQRETAKLEALIENISFDVSQLSVTPVVYDSQLQQQQQQQLQQQAQHARSAAASELVLRRCHQKRPVKFSKCYNDTLLRNCQKIGEGVYGEVFLCRKAHPGSGTTVMKVIPIEGETLVNGERQKQYDEILSEIVIAGELSALRSRSSRNRTAGFNQLQRVKCVQGAYPARLIDLWELYAETKGTENDNPSAFDPDQLYVVLELANAGSDLESFVFTNFIEVYHVFLQIVLSLAVAEAELQFEHRDLHWGNVLIQRVAADKQCEYVLRGQTIVVPTTSVEASIIDFTLSRIAYDNINFYNDLSQDPDLFNAEGDYQFEIYKLMQIANCNNWEAFQPKTNILWLHYLLDKMTSQLRMLRKQAGRAQKRLLLYWADCILDYASTLEFVEKVVLPHLAQQT